MTRFVVLYCLLCNYLKIATSEISGFDEKQRKYVPEPWYGDYAGKLIDVQKIGIKGHVYIVNASCIQLLGFTFHGNNTDCNRNVYFWVDYGDELTDKGVMLSNYENGVKPILRYENAHVVLRMPVNKYVQDFNTFGLWCMEKSKNFGYVTIPKKEDPPMAQEFPNNVVNTHPTRYSISFSPILIIDRKTIEIHSFRIDKLNPRDLTLVVGKGDVDQFRSKTNFIRVNFRGETDKHLPQCSDKEATDFIIELPGNIIVYDIDWIGIVWEKSSMLLAYAKLANISHRIPPYVDITPMQEQKDQPHFTQWPKLNVVGDSLHPTLTFQMGVPGGSRALASSSVPQYVWYVNGVMMPEIWLEKDVAYTLIIEGGDDKEHLFNPLYISNDSFGGYMNAQNKAQIAVYAGFDENGAILDKDKTKSFGSLCVWTEKSDVNPDDYDSFVSYRSVLTLKCLAGKAGRFRWTPTSKKFTSNQRIYYQSYTEAEMGGKIILFEKNDGPPQSSDFLSGVKREMTTKEQIHVKHSKPIFERNTNDGNGQNMGGATSSTQHRTSSICAALIFMLPVSLVLLR